MMASPVTVGKLEAVPGLKWDFVTQSKTRALRILAKSENATHFIAQPCEQGTLLGTATLAHSKGRFVSLAMMVLPALRQRGENGIAVFERADAYWFVALVQGNLAVLSDVTGNANTVMAAVDEFERFNAPEGGFCIAPGGFFTDRVAENLTLPDALASHERLKNALRYWGARLHPVSTHKANARRVLAGALCVAAWLGWHQWQELKAQEATEKQRQAFLASKKTGKVPPVTKPWVVKPVPSTTLAQCHQVWKTLPLSIAGWRLSSAECGLNADHQSILMTRYTRNDNGAVGDFALRLPVYFNATPVFDIPGSASTAQFVLPVVMPVPKSATDTLLPAQDALVELTTYIQHLQATVAIQKQSATAEKLPWQVYHVVVKTDIPPVHLFKQSVPGLRLTKVGFTLSQGRMHYTLQGELYAR